MGGALTGLVAPAVAALETPEAKAEKERRKAEVAEKKAAKEREEQAKIDQNLGSDEEETAELNKKDGDAPTKPKGNKDRKKPKGKF